MKKLTAILIAAILCLSLISCTHGNTDSTDTKDTEETQNNETNTTQGTETDAASTEEASDTFAETDFPDSNAKAREAYKALLLDIRSNPENYYPINDGWTDEELGGNTFSIVDIDGDGVEELAVSLNAATSMAEMNSTIWSYDASSDAVKEVGTVSPAATFYKSGYIVGMANHNQSHGSLWPYMVYHYDGKCIDLMYSIYSEEKEMCDIIELPFDEENDADHDGIIYYKFDYATEERTALTQAEYDELIGEYIPEKNALEYETYYLTESDISSIN